MTRNQRAWHAQIWIALSFGLALALTAALYRRSQTAAELGPAGAAQRWNVDRSAP